MMAQQPTYPAAFNIVRLCEIMLTSRAGVMSAAQIAAHLEISRKTAQRYLDIVFADSPTELFSVRTGGDLGYQGHDRRKKYLVINRASLEQRTGFQLAPLYFSHFFLSFLEGTTLDESMREALREFHDSIKEPGEQAIAGSLGRKLYVVATGPKSYKNHQAVIDRLLTAVILQCPIGFTYRKPGQPRTQLYRIRPLTLLIYKHGLYVIGENDEWPRPRFFAVERIKSIQVERGREHRFEYPRQYDPRDFCSGSFGIFQEETESKVAIRFSAPVADYVRARRWHPSQSITESADGSLILHLTVNGVQELVTWILGFGPEAEVMEPESLRNHCHEQLLMAVRRYEV